MKPSIWIAIIMLGAAGPSLAQYQIGDVVLDFTLPDLQGHPASLHEHLGHIVVLNFFTTWCPGCNEEAEHLENDIRVPYADLGVDVVAVNIQEQQALVQGWAAAMGVNYQILMAPDWELFQEFPMALSIPYNAVLAPDMTLRYASTGFSLDDIITIIEEIRAEGQVPVESHTFGYIKSLFNK